MDFLAFLGLSDFDIIFTLSFPKNICVNSDGIIARTTYAQSGNGYNWIFVIVTLPLTLAHLTFPPLIHVFGGMNISILETGCEPTGTHPIQ
jgi:hypothetical protein